MALIIIPIITMAVPGLENPLDYGPWVWLSVFYLWLGAIFFWMLGMTGLGIPAWGLYRVIVWWKNWKKNSTADLAGGEPVTKGGRLAIKPHVKAGAEGRALTRRQLLRLGLVAAPPLLVGGAGVYSWWAKQNLAVYSVDLPVVGLPPDLEGFTITHLSDLHLGLLTGLDRAEAMVAVTNRLASSLIVVTGDLLDRDLAYMPDLLETVKSLQAPLGVYVCIGNHDKMNDAGSWVDSVRRAELNLLLDEAVLVDTGKTPLKLLGIDFANNERLDEENIRRADRSLTAPEEAVKILLAHHPHAFDAAARIGGIPVTLAGHTHGGQLVVRLGENLELFNPGWYLFRYISGIYRSPAGQSLFVHKGSGDWFPLRLGAPAEIVQLRLVKEGENLTAGKINRLF